MADRELRRLKRRDLLQMLLIQCEETERLQQEADQLKAQMETIMESYERLKKKLDVKDERLNQKDAEIEKLSHEVKELRVRLVPAAIGTGRKQLGHGGRQILPISFGKAGKYRGQDELTAVEAGTGREMVAAVSGDFYG